jgi:pyroglutamyl-peptidase
MRILIYGFGPYRQFQDNVTERIVRILPQCPLVKTLVFPVKFHRRQFTKAIMNFKPDAVLGLGQCSLGRKLRIENWAANKRRDNTKAKPKSIVVGAPRRLKTNLPLDFGRQARVSNDAGTYVCNFSMYVILDYLKRHRLPTVYGFIHIPHRYNQRAATRLVLKAITTMQAGAKAGSLSACWGDPRPPARSPLASTCEPRTDVPIR